MTSVQPVLQGHHRASLTAPPPRLPGDEFTDHVLDIVAMSNCKDSF